MGKTYSACEIVELGIQIEKNGKDFYRGLAARANDGGVKQVLEYLAGEEEKHIEVFREIFSSSCDYEPEKAYPDEYFSYMNSLASSYVFTEKDKGREAAEKVTDLIAGVEMGVGFEKDSILFYQEMRSHVPESSRGLVDRLIEEEKRHLRKLLDIKGGN